MSLNQFAPIGSAEAISASGTSASATLSPAEGTVICISVIAVTTAVRMHIKTGSGATTATTDDFCLPCVVGQTHYITKPQHHDTVAIILNAGSATIYVTAGDGRA